MIKDIYLVRHAKTELNSQVNGPILYGSTDVPILNPKETKDAFQRKFIISETFKKAVESCEQIYTSKLIRTKETAECIKENPILVPYKEFNEINYGIYEKSQIGALPEDLINLWYNEPEKVVFEGGDSIKERADGVYDKTLEILNSTDKPVIIVSSYGILSLLITKMLNYPLVYFHKIDISNCAVLPFGYNDKNGRFFGV